MPHVHIVQHLRPGGIETMALDLADAAPGSTIISLEGSTDAVRAAWPRAANAKSDVIALGAPEGFSPQLVWKLAGVLRRLKPSGVVLHHIGPLIYGALAARLVGTKPIIHVEHDVWHYSRNARNAALSRLIERVAKPHHVCLSQSATRTVAETLQTGRIHVVRTGIDTTRFEIPGHAQKIAARAPFGIAPDAIVFGTVSRLVALKGHGLLLDAVAGLQAAVGRPVRMLIVGDGPERTGLEERVNADAELAPLVHFAGHRDDIGTCLQAMDVFCLPSLNEGTPRSVLEAQATGVPVIASNVGAVDECLEPTLNRIMPPGDADQLRMAMIAAASDLLTPDDRQTLRDFVCHRFDWHATVASYQHLLTEAAA